jgi:hypothetical protein
VAFGRVGLGRDPNLTAGPTDAALFWIKCLKIEKFPSDIL